MTWQMISFQSVIGSDLIGYCTYDTLVDFLPKMSSEDLDEGDLQSGNLAMEEDSR